jgi:hypothetical protein
VLAYRSWRRKETQQNLTNQSVIQRYGARVRLESSLGHAKNNESIRYPEIRSQGKTRIITRSCEEQAKGTWPPHILEVLLRDHGFRWEVVLLRSIKLGADQFTRAWGFRNDNCCLQAKAPKYWANAAGFVAAAGDLMQERTRWIQLIMDPCNSGVSVVGICWPAANARKHVHAFVTWARNKNRGTRYWAAWTHLSDLNKFKFYPAKHCYFWKKIFTHHLKIRSSLFYIFFLFFQKIRIWNKKSSDF